MGRPYITIKEYSKRHGIPRTTVQMWVRSGYIEAMKSVRPILIPDDQPVPYKDPSIHKWRYVK